MIWAAASALLNIVAGLLLKAASGGVHPFGSIVLALVAYGGAFTFYFLAMTHFPLAQVYLAIVALTAIGLSGVSWVIWNESLSLSQLTGFIIILTGLAVLNGS